MVASLAFPTILLRCGTAARPVPLLYARHEGAFLVAATNWGRREHPKWSTRLLEGCGATVALGRRTLAVRAERLSEAEVKAVWPILLAVWPAFDTYRARSGRNIRVFRLQPS